MINIDGKFVGVIGEVADSLNDLADRIRCMRPESFIVESTEKSPLERAKQHYRNRRKRDKLFGNNNLFGEPAWDMIVDLFIAGEEQKPISVSSLCIASACPMTTALRWISILENAGIVVRKADEHDARRFYLSLNADVMQQLKLHFADDVPP